MDWGINILYIILVIYCLQAIKEYMKIKSLGKPLLQIKRRFNFWIFIGICSTVSLIWHIEGYFNNGQGWVSLIVNGAVILLVMLRGSIQQRICEEGIVSYDGIFTWAEIKNYNWIDSLNTGIRKGISFEINKKSICREIIFFINEEDVKSANHVINDNKVKMTTS